MKGQGEAKPGVDEALLRAAAEVVADVGMTGLTLERLARQAGTSRMTLHRRQVTLPAVLAGLAEQVTSALREAFWPALTAQGTGGERLRRAVEALCVVADDHLPLLAGLYTADGGLFHAPPDAKGSVPTHADLIAPLTKLLCDGADDGSLRRVDDPQHWAALLFNTIGWGYIHLRHSQQWPAASTRRELIDLILHGLSTAPAGA
ncbi:TetR/AcrR family transcriptional regulator [Micromonospora chalcea]|uniref:TetR/AcrR family transcriptional regulator n=1 Tax=Micromonospora chalcea TaxID=1874 RepID=UPI0021A29D73|nr:TetR/AcrR family transcriptional regulator [Micromonospora chalcea]MCT2281841.1 TetR/AcrR family transcriptional regulator [Micromonospora chalcea]